MMNAVSVIVPVYNTSAYLSGCVDSLLSQTVPPKEIILVDDGSDDGSGALCDAYAAGHPHLVRVLHQEHMGPAAARNQGICESKGDCLSFVDSDDYLEKNAFERLLKAADDSDIIFGDMIIEAPETGKSYCLVREPAVFYWNTEEALIELCSYRYLHVSCCLALYRRQLFDHIRFPPDTLCEDYFIQHRLIGSSTKVGYTAFPFYDYVQRPESRSRSSEVSLAPVSASDAQLAFFRAHFPGIVWAAESDCLFARAGVYNAFLRQRGSCPRGLRKKLRKESRAFLKSVVRNGHLPAIKKMQAIAFCCCLPAYRFVITRTEHR